MEAKQLQEILSGAEDEIGRELSGKEQTFALTVVNGETNSEAARQAGCPDRSAGARGYEMSNDPAIQRAIEEAEKYAQIPLTEDFIKHSLMKEAVTAASSRDRQSALGLLGKTKGMFRDVLDTHTHQSNDDFLEMIEKEWGKDWRDKMESELGGEGESG